MSNKYATRLGVASVLILALGFTATSAQAAAVSATAQLFGVSTVGTPILTFSNDQYAQGAQNSLGGDLFHFGSSQRELFLNDSIDGGNTVATARSGIESDLPVTNAGTIGNAAASAYTTYSFDYVATGAGQVFVDFDYLYSVTILDIQAGEQAGVSSSVVAVEEGKPGTNVSALFFFSNQENNDFGSERLRLTLNVLDGQTGTISFTAASQGFTTAVPVPAAVWLFGSALIGMLRLRRK
ncbi:MAG: hypothetical protein WC782_00365 [Methylococcaceae bacterium]|jgi:hypothetical protein